MEKKKTEYGHSLISRVTRNLHNQDSVILVLEQGESCDHWQCSKGINSEENQTVNNGGSYTEHEFRHTHYALQNKWVQNESYT